MEKRYNNCINNYSNINNDCDNNNNNNDIDRIITIYDN